MSLPHPSSAHSDRPNLDQKRKLAKDLLRAVRRLDADQARRFTWNLPRFRGQTGHDVIREGVRLADAQHVIARESGFESWRQLVDYVRCLDEEPGGPVAAFENAVRAIIRGDVSELSRLLAEHQDLATMRSSRHHQAVLPHYLAANGVENEHQVCPPNAVEVAETLFAAGADAVVDSTADFYGGGGGSTPLVGLVTSTHPHEAGVQADLVRAFCQAGASVDGIDNDGLPLASALGFRYPDAARALADCGARIDHLVAAAALGDANRVQRFLQVGSGPSSVACTFHNPLLELPESNAPHPDETLGQAFVFACMSGQLETAEMLLDAGVDINSGPRQGITAMHESAYQGHIDVLKFLLSRGADPLIRDRQWMSTPIGWADGGKQTATIDFLLDQDRVDFLDAVELRRYDLVSSMLSRDPDLANAPNGEGGALRFAAFQGDARLAEMLLAAGADASLKNENELTALDYAQKGGHDELIEMLS